MYQEYLPLLEAVVKIDETGSWPIGALSPDGWMAQKSGLISLFDAGLYKVQFNRNGDPISGRVKLTPKGIETLSSLKEKGFKVQWSCKYDGQRSPVVVEKLKDVYPSTKHHGRGVARNVLSFTEHHPTFIRTGTIRPIVVNPTGERVEEVFFNLFFHPDKGVPFFQMFLS